MHTRATHVIVDVVIRRPMLGRRYCLDRVRNLRICQVFVIKGRPGVILGARPQSTTDI